MVLILFVYAVLGVNLFAKSAYQDAYSPHANFRNFGNATLTLFRMSTGESWHEIMYDSIRSKSITFDCSEDLSFKERNGEDPIVCGPGGASRFYFITFMILVSFIFINLFIAIILESFADSTAEEGLQVGGETMTLFNELW